MEHSAGSDSRANEDSHAAAADADAGNTLFVINLSASMTPLPDAAVRIAGLEQFKIFQVCRVEDGRPRHRLRLGFFSNEADAESVIAILRERYPTAFITVATNEDRRYLKNTARQSVVAKTVTATAPQIAKPVTAKAPAKPVAQPTAAATKQASAPQQSAARPPRADATASKSQSVRSPPADTRSAPLPATTTTASKAANAIIELTYGDAPISNGSSGGLSAAVADGPQHAALPPAAARFQTQASSVIDFSIEAEARKAAPAREPQAGTNPKPFHVGAHAEVPFLDLGLEADPFSTGESGSPMPLGSKGAAASAAIEKLSGDEIWRIPDLDSTQTIRTLTKTEVTDANQPKWFVVQLALSNQAVNFDAMPQLDIFSAYRLYSVAVMEEGKILHALRLGFFKEDVSAEAVCGYVRTFFPSPAIIRVSAAEQTRFVDAPMPKPKDARKVVEIGGARERADAKANGTSASAFKSPAAQVAKPDVQHPASNKAARASDARPTLQAGAPTGSPRFSQPAQRESSLEDKLRQAAQEIAATDSGIRRVKNNPSLLSRLVGRLKS